jgi:hypothetical protein
MRRLTHLIVLAAFIASCGGHWYLLQAVAWVNMIHEYSQMVPLGEAVSMTFSGQYPCPICKAIAEKKQSERDKLCALDKIDKRVAPPLSVALAQPEPQDARYADFDVLLRSRAESPPTPPPRFLLS